MEAENICTQIEMLQRRYSDMADWNKETHSGKEDFTIGYRTGIDQTIKDILTDLRFLKGYAEESEEGEPESRYTKGKNEFTVQGQQTPTLLCVKGYDFPFYLRAVSMFNPIISVNERALKIEFDVNRSAKLSMKDSIEFMRRCLRGGDIYRYFRNAIATFSTGTCRGTFRPETVRCEVTDLGESLYLKYIWDMDMVYHASIFGNQVDLDSSEDYDDFVKTIHNKADTVKYTFEINKEKSDD